jgi:hypothetical protein
VPCTTLQRATDKHESHADPNRRSSTQSVSKIETRQSAYKSTQLERGNDDALNGRVVHGWEDTGEGGLSDDTTHDRHVITEEPERTCRDESDGKVETKTTKTQGCGIRGELEHVVQ